MKRFTLILALLLAVISFTFAQKSPADRITPALKAELEKRKGADEQFRIIIGMAEKFDQAKLSKQVETMKSEQRREFVINELSCFSAATQADLLKTLNEGQKANIVKDVKSFWIFNGVSCVTTREMIYALSERPDIAYIESDEMRNMLPEASLEMKKQNFKVENPQATKTNRDGAKSIAWNVTQVHADQVWSQYNINGSGVVVAVIDTGLDYYHPDIFNHIWQPQQTTFTFTHSGDENTTTYTLGTFTYNDHTYTLPGWDFVNNDNDPLDDNGHGSHCAGTVAGYGTSGIQTGMAPGATIMALKVLSGAGSGSSTGIMKAMEFAVAAGADVVSMSLGGHSSGLGTLLGADDSYRTAFISMMNIGVVAMVAAGNEGEIYNQYHEQASGLLGIAGDHYAVPDNVGNPGNCPSPWANPEQPNQGGRSAVVTIGASNRNDRKATFSSFGPCTWKRSVSSTIYSDYEYDKDDPTKPGLIKPDVLVPGTDITSLLYSYHRPIGIEGDTTGTGIGHVNTTKPYVAECGTSMATPGAAGITALIIQAWKDTHNNVKPTPAEIDELLEITALPVDFRDTKNNTTGAGRADAKAAVDAIYTTATKPTGFQITNLTDGVVNNGGCVHLSWTASTAPKGYAIYRDNEQVGTTFATTYTDKNPGAGKHTYYVRAIDNADIQSVRSKAAFCTVQPYAFADDASITWNDATQTATLGWTPTLSNSATTGDLKYIDISNTISAFGGQGGSTVYWGMCFNPEDLREYQGMSITTIDLGIYKTSAMGIADDDVYLNIYRGTTFGNTTGTPVYREKFSIPQSAEGWTFKTLTLTTPYAITDITEDLWITFSDYITSTALGSIQEYPMTIGPYNGHNSNVFYMGSTKKTVNPEEDLVWSHIPDFGDAYNYAVSFECHLERTTTYTDSYTIDYPDATQDVTISGISGNYTTTHTPTLASGENNYEITAKVSTGGSVVNTSCPEELKVVKVDSSTPSTVSNASNINIDQTKVYLVQSDGVITSDGITCTDPTRLIIEDGGQVISSNTGVKATVKKEIATGYSYSKDHWYAIASPIVGSTTPTGISNNTFDLYSFDQSGANSLEWISLHSTPALTNGTGYLYANSGTTTLKSTGELAASVDPTTLVYDGNVGNRVRGFNLIGNPYPCNTYVTAGRSFYVLQENITTHESEFALGDNPIKPGQAILVQTTAKEDNEGTNTVTFNKPAISQSNQDNCITVSVMKANLRGDAFLDRARVSFTEGDQLTKYNLNEQSTKLYIPMDGEQFAVAYAADNKEMPVSFQPASNGTYTLSVENNNEELAYLHLIDNMTGTDTDLLQTPSYTFEASTDNYASRFRLLFGPANDNADADDIFAYVGNQEIRLLVQPQDGAILQVVDVTGRVMTNENVSGDVSGNVSTANMAPGVYVLRLIEGEGVRTQKVVIE